LCDPGSAYLSEENRVQFLVLNRFFEQAPFPIGLVEIVNNWTDIRYVFVNEACARRIGLTAALLRGCLASSVLPADELSEMLEIFHSIRGVRDQVVSTGERQLLSGW
jgi:hypothetical protein